MLTENIGSKMSLHQETILQSYGVCVETWAVTVTTIKIPLEKSSELQWLIGMQGSKLLVTLAVFQEKITIEDYFWGWLDKKKCFWKKPLVPRLHIFDQELYFKM